MRTSRKWFLILFLPGLTGLFLFYFLPFIISFILSFWDFSGSKFTWFDNYLDSLQNEVFLTAAKNTVIFTALSLFLNMSGSFLFSCLLHFSRLGKYIPKFLFILPLAIPSVGIASYWNRIFHHNGIISLGVEAVFNTGPMDFTAGILGYIPLLTLFLWKNMGFSSLIYLSSFKSVSKEYYDVFKLECNKKIKYIRYVLWPSAFPGTFFILIISFINAMNIFRETYALWKDYPPRDLYILQHYIYNNFLKLNYENSLTAGFVLAIFVILFILWLLKKERRFNEN